MKQLLPIAVFCIGIFSFQNAKAQSCDTLRNYSLTDAFYEISGDYGAFLGHDKVNGGTSNVTQWAEPYSVSASTEVRRLVFVPWVVHDEGGQVTFNVYQDNAGVPGAILGSQSIPLSDFDENVLTEVDFPTPVVVNGSFFVGYELEYNTPQDTFAILGTHKPGGINYTKYFADGTWTDVDQTFTIPPDDLISAWRLDVLCSNAPDPIADFTADGTSACLGNNFNLDGTPSQNVDQYLWYLTGTSATPTHDTDEGINGTLTPTVTGNDQEIYLIADGGCKTDGVYVTVDVFDAVSASAATVNTTCGLNNGEINITSPTGGSGTYSYSIDNGTSFQSSGSYTGVAPGTYTVIVNTGGNGCSYSETVTVGATPKETITIGIDQTVCAGESATITASGTGTIEWFDGATSVGTTNSISVSPSTTTTYDAVLTDANGCEDTDQVVVNVNALPTIATNADEAICNGDNTTISATGGTSYTWDNSLGAGPSHIVSPNTNTTYEVIGTDANGCENSDQITITVNSLPTVTASADQTTCAGETISISASGTSSYSWDNGLGAGSTQSVAPTATTTYEVTGTDANGCEDTDQVTINVDPLPTVTTSTDDAICNGDNITISATGGNSYTWDNGLGTGASQNVSPTATTTYEVTGTDANGCENTDQVTITVNNIDDASFTFNNYCDVATSNGPTIIATAGGTFAFNPAPSDGATIDASSGEISNGVTGTTYSVEYTTNGTCPSSSIETVTVESNDDPTFDYENICIGNGLPIEPYNIATSGGTFSFTTAPADGATIDASTGAISGYTQGSTYEVEYLTPTGVCQANSTINVEVFNAPTVTASTDATICDGDNITISATGGDSYTWNNSLGTGASHNVNPNTTTTYIVTGEDNTNGCTNTDDVTLTVNPTPTIDTGTDQTICEGISATITATGGDTYTWDNNLGTGQSHAVSPTTTTTYEVVGQNASGCENISQVTINVDPVPATDAGTDQEVCEGNEVTLTASGADSYTWDNGVTQGDPFTPSLGSTTYTVVGLSANGCEASDEVIVTVNELPVVDAGVDKTTCDYYDPVTLNGSPMGGTFSGTGVTGNEFDPSVGVGTYTLTYIYTDGNGCETSDDLSITVDGCASINENDISSGIVVMPNPATDYLDVVTEGKQEIKSIQLVSAEGRVVKTSSNTIDQNTTRLDVSQAETGTYFIQLSTSKGVITKKVIIH